MNQFCLPSSSLCLFCLLFCIYPSFYDYIRSFDTVLLLRTMPAVRWVSRWPPTVSARTSTSVRQGPTPAWSHRDVTTPSGHSPVSGIDSIADRCRTFTSARQGPTPAWSRRDVTTPSGHSPVSGIDSIADSCRTLTSVRRGPHTCMESQRGDTTIGKVR